MLLYQCRKCGKEYEQNLKTRNDLDIHPHCRWVHWDPKGILNKNWKSPS